MGGRPRGRFSGEGVVVAALVDDLFLGGRPLGRFAGESSLCGDVVTIVDFGGGVFSLSAVLDLVPVTVLSGDVDNLRVDTLASEAGATRHAGQNHLRTGTEVKAGLRQNM